MSEHLFWHHHGGVSVPNLDEAIKWYHDMELFEMPRNGVPAVSL